MIKKLIKGLKEDPELRLGWKSNIAMAFYDEYLSYKKYMDKKYINKRDLHLIANDAADNFINLLIKDVDVEAERDLNTIANDSEAADSFIDSLIGDN